VQDKQVLHQQLSTIDARFDHMSTSNGDMQRLLHQNTVIVQNVQLLTDNAGNWSSALQGVQDQIALINDTNNRLSSNRRLFDELQTPLHFTIMSYQGGVFTTDTVFSPEDDGVWTFADCNGDGFQDLVYIKTSNTGTGKIEVHGAPNESRFQEHTLHTGTAFPVGDQGTWLMQDWTGDGKADLIYIKKRNTGTKMVEIHVATAASGYQKFALQIGTCFECENGEREDEDDGVWSVSRKGDLVYIKTRNCGSGKIEYHIASRASNYQQFTHHTPTDFDVENDGTYCIAPARSGDFADLYYINTSNTTGSGKVEVHAVSASSRWKSRLVDVVTSFEPDDNGRWLMAQFSHQGRPDLVYIKTSSCESGKVEVHVVGSR
jgi:hypothetical protein